MSTVSSPMPLPIRTRWREVGSFVLVGVLNTALDFAVLNILIAVTHHTSGGWLFGFDLCAFSIGVISSYVLNARITFRQQGLGNGRTIALFVSVSLVGLLINASLVLMLSMVLGHAVSPTLAINGGKLVATGASLCWNYLAMRRWVFGNGK